MGLEAKQPICLKSFAAFSSWDLDRRWTTLAYLDSNLMPKAHGRTVGALFEGKTSEMSEL